MADQKKCSACGVVKTPSEFYRRGDRDAPRSCCKECERVKRAAEAGRHAKRAREWRDADPERAKESRLASWGRHKEKHNERRRKLNDTDQEYRDNNRRRCRAWHNANVERHREISKEFRVANPQYNKDYLSAYAKANPDKFKAYNHKRRALKAEAKGFWTAADVLEMRKLQGNRCAVCLEVLRGVIYVDHIRAITKGGSNWPFNLQLLCKSCNSRKYNKDFTEFLIEMGLI